MICTAWPEFSELDLGKLGEVMAFRNLVDGRNLLDGTVLADSGFAYRAMGRPRSGVGRPAPNGSNGS